MSTLGTIQLTSAQMEQVLVEQYTVEAVDAGIPVVQTDTGSTLGSMFNANTLLALQLQQQLAYLAAVARAATSTGPDLDSFWLPFEIIRDAATFSSGQVVFSYSSVSSQQVIPVGAIAQTQGGLLFLVVEDGTNENYNATLNGYPVGPGSNVSVSTTVNCLQSGINGNVAANTITLPYVGTGGSPIPGTPTINNPNAFTNGSNSESDQAFNYRATITVSSGRVATLQAIGAAILGVESGLTYSIGDRENPDGSTQAAYFTVVVNVLGQSSSPSIVLIDAVESAVNNVRAAGISFEVIGPTLRSVGVTGTYTLAQGYSSVTVGPALITAYQTFVNNVGLNAAGGTTTVSYGRCFAALLAVPGVADIQNLSLNGGTSDVSTTVFSQQLVAGNAIFTTS